MKRALVFATAVLCAAGFPLALYLVFIAAPQQDLLYFNQKIFYFHVPCAFMMFVAVFVCGIWSIRYLRTRDPRHDEVAFAAAELGVVFGLIVLVTGSVWAKAAWNVWWNWETRITSSLLLWMVMLAYVLVRKYGGPGFERLAAGLGIFGMADVPLIYISVNIWNRQHPKTSAVPGLEGGMRTAFWVSVLVFLCLFLLLLQVRLAVGRARRAVQDIREDALDAGVLE